MNFVPTFIAIIIAIAVTLGAFGFLGKNAMFSMQKTKTPATSAPEEVMVPHPDGDTMGSKSKSVATATSGVHGNYLTDPKGRAVYVTTKTSCTGDCLKNWPPYLLEGEFRSDGKLSVVMRDDVRRAQYTWEGKQLYYYAGDTAAGDTKGDGVGNAWYLVKQ